MDYNKNQIIRIDGRNSLMEVMSDAMGIGQIQLNFATYDQSRDAGSRQTGFVSIYVSIPEALCLSEDIILGRFKRNSEMSKAQAKAENSNYPKPIFSTIGGTSAEKLRAMGKSRPDGMALSRQFKIIPGDKLPYLLVAEQGAGEANEKGLIVPRYGGKPDTRITIGVSEELLMQVACMIKVHVQAFYNSLYVTGVFSGSKEKKELAV